MKIHSLEQRLALVVGLGLLLFNLVAGGLTYAFLFRDQVQAADAQQKQLVLTVQAQAEVAVFAHNAAIAEGVIEGLLASPVIQGVRIAGTGGFEVTGGLRTGDQHTRSVFVLRSPVDGKQVIGELVVLRNLEVVRLQARDHALAQTALMFLEVFIAAGLLMAATRRWISRPVARLAHQVAAIEPGSGARVDIPSGHERDEIGQLAASANHLISSAEDALAEVRALATQDPLTGLPNRRHFMARLREEFDRIKRYQDLPVSVVMLDLDWFKQVNDRYGHAAGDAVLRYFADLIQAEVRKLDTPGRLGGEEFAILLPGTHVTEAAAFAERLRRNLASRVIATAAGDIPVTASLGIASLWARDASPEAALGRADAALYRAKALGRNRVEIEPGGGSTLPVSVASGPAEPPG